MMQRKSVVLALIISGLLTACQGGSHGALPPTSVSHHTQANAAAASVVQWNSSDAYAASSIAVVFPSAPAVGDVLVVTFWNNGQNSGAANTYTPPGSWSLVDQNVSHTFAGYQTFSHIVATGETNRYVFTPQTAQRETVWIAVDVSNALGVDKGANAYISGGTSYTTPTVTPSQTGDLALAFNLPFTGSALTWSNPSTWTFGIGPTTTWRGESLYQSLSTSAPVSESSTLSAAAPGFSAIVLLSTSGAPPPPPTPTPVPVGNPPSVSQWTNSSAYAPKTIAVSWPNAPATGDLLVVAFWNNGQNTGAANVYTPPTGWTLVDQNTAHSFTGYQTFSHVAGAGENNSYIFTPATPVRSHVWIGADITSAGPIEKSGNLYISNSTSYTTPTLTASQKDLAVVFNLPLTGSALTWTNPSGWTLGTGPTGTWRGESVFQALTSPGAISESSKLSAAASGFSGMVLIVPSAPATPSPAPVYADWPTFGDTLQRTGFNANEATLSASSLSSGPLKLAWQAPVDLGAAITAQPILATNVTVQGTPANVLYVGAENNVFYAINADSGTVLWKNTTLGSALSTNCTDLPSNQFGITETATYDRNANAVYVADASDNVHALDMTTGVEQWSVNVLFDPNSNTTVGVPAQDHIYGALTFNPANGMLYVGTGSLCDIEPWHGRIVAINTLTHAVVAAFFPGRSGLGKTGTVYCGGGIWGMGGASIDATTNDVFVATGNMVTTATNGCTADPNGETYPYGDSIVQLDPQLTYISSDPASVGGVKASGDSDYGATPMLYAESGCTSEQLSAKNKNGYLYTYAVGTAGITAEQQLRIGNTTSEGQFIGVPAVDPPSGLVFVGNPNANGNYAHGLNALQPLAGCGGFGLAWKASIGGANVSGNDNQAPTVAKGVVYFTDGLDNKLWAFKTTDGTPLWNSGSLIGSPCTTYGTACGVFSAATVDGRVFVGSWNHKLYAFGI